MSSRTLLVAILTFLISVAQANAKIVVPLPAGTQPARKGAVSLLCGTPLSYDLSKDGFLTVTLPTSRLEDIDTVIAVAK